MNRLFTSIANMFKRPSKRVTTKAKQVSNVTLKKREHETTPGTSWGGDTKHYKAKIDKRKPRRKITKDSRRVARHNDPKGGIK